METTPLSTVDALERFHAEAPALRHPAVRGRVGRVRAHLEVFLDTESERWLLPDELALVEAERQIDPAGAVARVTGPEALVAVLPGFLDDGWLLPHAAEAFAQVQVVSELLDWLTQRSIIDAHDMACSVLEVEAQLRRARRVLARRTDDGHLQAR